MKLNDAIEVVSGQVLLAIGENIEECKFCLDSQLEQPEIGRLSIGKDNLHDVFWFREMLATYLRDGVSWIHSSIMQTNEHTVIVSIAHGKSVGNPNPAMNFSHEKRVCEILKL